VARGRRALHARPCLRPAGRDEDRLAGLHANTQIPKIVGALRLWEEGLPDRYRTIAANFWQIATDHHSYVIGGNSNGEAFPEPDVVAGQLSDSTRENCNSYNVVNDPGLKIPGLHNGRHWLWCCACVVSHAPVREVGLGRLTAPRIATRPPRPVRPLPCAGRTGPSRGRRAGSHSPA